ncbi:MAG: tRNA (guanine(10)-N(2))-dimethyltransferase [Candidatus Micrarchaeota archaeon]|nr:tRNA (guanine(10)-N(2))-dimethyltransferase [Candidatus Micrarchaeota archaeon]
MKIVEGEASLIVPKDCFKDPFHQPVFFNPRMEFNRTVSVAAVRAARALVGGAVLLDGLSGTGPRGIRYLLESGVEKAVFVEANPDAVKVLEKNIALNKIAKKRFEVVEKDLNAALVGSEERFDFIEIDPFGSPVFYLENAIRRLKKTAVLSVTATDLSCLCGAEPSPCVRKYGAAPLKTEYCHEIAVRILLGKIASAAAMLDFGTAPLLSFYQGHAVKVIALMEKSAEKADASVNNIGFVNHCFNCLARSAGKTEGKCACGKKFSHAGPLWLGETSDTGFVENVLKGLNKREEDGGKVRQLLELIVGENCLPPGFFESGTVAKSVGKTAPPLEELLGKLRAAGHRAVRTHYSPTGFRASAPAGKVRDLFVRWKRR